MSAEWAALASQPIVQPTSANQKTLFAIVNLSLMPFTQAYPNSNEPFIYIYMLTTLKLPIMWGHMATMALRGLSIGELVWALCQHAQRAHVKLFAIISKS